MPDAKPRCVKGARLCEIRIAPVTHRLMHSNECPDRPNEPISLQEYSTGQSWPPPGVKRR